MRSVVLPITSGNWKISSDACVILRFQEGPFLHQCEKTADVIVAEPVQPVPETARQALTSQREYRN
jgi:hypothetical protein